MRKSIVASTLVLAGLIASPTLLYAQADPSSDGRDTTTFTDRDNSSRWGWLGLLGLVGLLGLKRSDREKMRDQSSARASV